MSVSKPLALAAAALSGWSLLQAQGARIAPHGNGVAAVAPEATKLIAGVPIYNYHLAFDQERAVSFLQETKGETVAGREHWIVMMKSGVPDAELERVCSAHPSQCSSHGHESGVPFLMVEGTEAELQQVLEDAPGEVAFVEPDTPTFAIPELPVDGAGEADDGSASIQNANSWGLRRIGVPDTPNPNANGRGVHVYVLDTGIRYGHTDFGGRALPAIDLTSNVLVVCNGNQACAFDRQGHGTHCAGTVGGTRFGVAPGATLYSAKVLADNGSGSFAWSVSALDWISRVGLRPAVASMSLGGSGTSQSQLASVNAAVNAGVTVVVAAGNSASNACNFQPAFVPSAITVGATENSGNVASYSNWGTCVNILAPGSAIPSAGHLSDVQVVSLSGTSMACPHVSGAAAMLLQATPTLAPAAVLSNLLATAERNVITGNLRTAPNVLLNVRSYVR